MHTWAENGEKHKSEKTWLYNMFGKKIIEDDKSFLLKVFPYYSGFYVKFFPLQKEKKTEYDEWGFGGDAVLQEDDMEWLADMAIQKEEQNAKIPHKDICYTVLNIDGLYDCYVKNQQQFLQEKWATLRQKDSTLPENIRQFVRLYYDENQLKKVVFMNSVDDESGIIILKLKKDRNVKTKAQKEVEKLLFQMPSYIIPQTSGRKRKIVFDYHIY